MFGSQFSYVYVLYRVVLNIECQLLIDVMLRNCQLNVSSVSTREMETYILLYEAQRLFLCMSIDFGIRKAKHRESLYVYIYSYCFYLTLLLTLDTVILLKRGKWATVQDLPTLSASFLSGTSVFMTLIGSFVYYTWSWPWLLAMWHVCSYVQIRVYNSTCLSESMVQDYCWTSLEIVDHYAACPLGRMLAMRLQMTCSCSRCSQCHINASIWSHCSVQDWRGGPFLLR